MAVFSNKVRSIGPVYDDYQRVEQHLHIGLHVGTQFDGNFSCGPSSIIANGNVLSEKILRQNWHELRNSWMNMIKTSLSQISKQTKLSMCSSSPSASPLSRSSATIMKSLSGNSN